MKPTKKPGIGGLSSLTATVLTACAILVQLAGAARAQTCSWGGTSSVPPPTSTHLRAVAEPFRSPGRVAVGADGRIYATDPGAGQVVVRDALGRSLAVRDGFRTPLAIAAAATGEVYLGEQGTGAVSVFDRDWLLVDQLGAGPSEFALPTDIALDPADGRIFVADGGADAIKVYSPSGALLLSFGGPGTAAGRFDFPAAVYVSPAGEVFVADQNNDRVQVFDRDGNFLRCFGRRGGSSFSRRFGRVAGLAGDGLGRLYVADAFQGQVKVFDAQGVALSTIGSFGEGPGQLRTPVGLALDPFNRLFVASLNTGRLEVFGIDDFTDPTAVEATVEIRPTTLNAKSRGRVVTGYIELPGARLDQVDLRSITANGVPAEPRQSAVGDFDRDGVPDLMVKFDRRSLVATLPTGPATVVVAGALVDGTFFEGAAAVRVVHGEDAREEAAGGLRR